MAERTQIDWATADEKTLDMAAGEFVAMYDREIGRRVELHFSLSDLDRAADEFLVRYGPAKALAGRERK